MVANAQGTVPKLKLLVPINFTHKSEMALDFALVYSQNVNADVYLFHVFEDSTKDYRQLDRLNEEYMERMKQVMLLGIKRLQQRGINPSVEDVHRRLERLRRERDTMGPVNLRADQEAEEIQTSLDTMASEKADLEAAIDKFSRSKILPEYLGKDYCRYYAMNRRAEAEKFHNAVSQLDFDWYLRSV